MLALALAALGLGAQAAPDGAPDMAKPIDAFAGVPLDISSGDLVSRLGGDGAQVTSNGVYLQVTRQVEVHGVKLKMEFSAMNYGGIDALSLVHTVFEAKANAFPAAECADVWARLRDGFQADYGPGEVVETTTNRALSIKRPGAKLDLKVRSPLAQWAPQADCDVTLFVTHDIVPPKPRTGPDGKPWTSTTMGRIAGFKDVSFGLSRAALLAQLGPGASVSADGRSVTPAKAPWFHGVELPVVYDLAGEGEAARVAGVRIDPAKAGAIAPASMCGDIWQDLQAGLTQDYGPGDMRTSSGRGLSGNTAFDNRLEIRAGDGSSATLRVRSKGDCSVELAVRKAG